MYSETDLGDLSLVAIVIASRGLDGGGIQGAVSVEVLRAAKAHVALLARRRGSVVGGPLTCARLRGEERGLPAATYHVVSVGKAP